MDKLNKIFKLLCDETRLRIIILLAQEQLCVCQISGILNISQSLASKHLSKLRDMDFVFDKRQDRFIFYNLVVDNMILKGVTDNILNHIQEFPQLMLDQSRIGEKEKFFTLCQKRLDNK